MHDYKKIYETYIAFREDEDKPEPEEIQTAGTELEKALRAVRNQDIAQSIDLAVGRLLRLHEVEGFAAGCAFMRAIRSVSESA